MVPCRCIGFNFHNWLLLARLQLTHLENIRQDKAELGASLVSNTIVKNILVNHCFDDSKRFLNYDSHEKLNSGKLQLKSKTVKGYVSMSMGINKMCWLTVN